MDSMAEDWGKVMICDLIIGMCQTEDEILADYRNEPYSKAMTQLVNAHTPEILLMGATTLVLFLLHTYVLVTITAAIVVYFGVLRMLREPLLIEIKRVILRIPANEPVAEPAA